MKDFAKWINMVEAEVLRESAKQVVQELKVAGPYYSGEFERNWVVVPGAKNIPGTVTEGTRPKVARNRIITQTPIPQPQNDSLTIGNRMDYKLVAQDLVPGRLKEGGGAGSANQDWFTTYASSQIQNALKKGVSAATQDSAIRNFKGS
jgi:hypothetical protein